jgi:hypothetical protein
VYSGDFIVAYLIPCLITQGIVDEGDDSTPASVKSSKVNLINWYGTIMAATDVKSIVSLQGAVGVQKIVEDWKCGSDGEEDLDVVLFLTFRYIIHA